MEPNGFLPLLYISRSDKAERADKVRILLDYGAYVNAVGTKGRTTLHWAASAGHVKVMTMLLEYGTDLTQQDQWGYTALSLAQAAGKTAAARLLEKHRAKR
ncbi:MAG: ankyrin repeat domain-containing protein [Anaerolineae bacterium]|nr:ankyrin repeat domain-containing protein [Anaerolineae bacterium]